MSFMLEIDESLNVLEEVPRTEKRDIKRLLESLKEMQEEAERLKRVETEFLKTRDAELLKPFSPDERDINPVTLKEPIPEPRYLSNIAQLREQAKTDKEKQACELVMQWIREDAKLFNPDAEIHIVEKTDGRKSLAVIGVDAKEFAAFSSLRDKEREVERNLARARRDLGEAIANHPTTIKQAPEQSHSYIPAIIPSSPVIAANRKVMQH